MEYYVFPSFFSPLWMLPEPLYPASHFLFDPTFDQPFHFSGTDPPQVLKGKETEEKKITGEERKGNVKEKNSKAKQSCPILNTNAQQIFGPINFIRVLNLFGVINPVPTLHSEHIPQIAMFPHSSHVFKAEKQETLFFFCGAAAVKIFRNCCFEQNVRNFFRG